MKKHNYILDMSLVKKELISANSVDDLSDFFQRVSICETDGEIFETQMKFIEKLLKSFWVFTKDKVLTEKMLEDLYEVVSDIQEDKKLCIITFARMAGLYVHAITIMFSYEDTHLIIGAKEHWINLTTSN